MKKLFLLFFVLHFVSYGQKADGLEICFEVQKSLKGFAADKEADDALDEILAVIGAAKNFYLIPCDEINNALALTYKGERFILYDKDFIDRINKATNDWSGKFILAHEVGHHINGHTRDFLIASVLNDQTKEKQREEELEADEFAGFIVAKLGAKYNQIKELMNTISSEKDDRYSTHPNRSKRLEAIKKGFDKVKILTPKQEQIVVKTPKKEEKKEVVVIEPEKKTVLDKDKSDSSIQKISKNNSNSTIFNVSKLTKSEREELNLKRGIQFARESGSKWDLWIPYDINLKVLESTGKLIFEWLIYLIILILIVTYIYKSYKTKRAIKKTIAREIIYHFALFLVGFALLQIANFYNDSGDERILTSVKTSMKEDWRYWSKIKKQLEIKKVSSSYKPISEILTELGMDFNECQGFRSLSSMSISISQYIKDLRDRGLTEDEMIPYVMEFNSGTLLYPNAEQVDTYKNCLQTVFKDNYGNRVEYPNGESNTFLGSFGGSHNRVILKFERSSFKRYLISKHYISYWWFAPKTTATPYSKGGEKYRVEGHEYFMILDFVLFFILLRFLFLLVMWVIKTLKS